MNGPETRADTLREHQRVRDTRGANGTNGPATRADIRDLRRFVLAATCFILAYVVIVPSYIMMADPSVSLIAIVTVTFTTFGAILWFDTLHDLVNSTLVSIYNRITRRRSTDV